ncbi:hypothetical protein B0J18DRAFT_38604 [Chaetomium sp. MPI-SDFR-AT-0129]|nr:hypothetical protein B0J18DRAFT_38604 [Chaetomium sp. MPI-SDFR-AT-0129]
MSFSPSSSPQTPDSFRSTLLSTPRYVSTGDRITTKHDTTPDTTPRGPSPRRDKLVLDKAAFSHRPQDEEEHDRDETQDQDRDESAEPTQLPLPGPRARSDSRGDRRLWLGNKERTRLDNVARRGLDESPLKWAGLGGSGEGRAKGSAAAAAVAAAEQEQLGGVAGPAEQHQQKAGTAYLGDGDDRGERVPGGGFPARRPGLSNAGLPPAWTPPRLFLGHPASRVFSPPSGVSTDSPRAGIPPFSTSFCSPGPASTPWSTPQLIDDRSSTNKTFRYLPPTPAGDDHDNLTSEQDTFDVTTPSKINTPDFAYPDLTSDGKMLGEDLRHLSFTPWRDAPTPSGTEPSLWSLGPGPTGQQSVLDTYRSEHQVPRGGGLRPRSFTQPRREPLRDITPDNVPGSVGEKVVVSNNVPGQLIPTINNNNIIPPEPWLPYPTGPTPPSHEIISQPQDSAVVPITTPTTALTNPCLLNSPSSTYYHPMNCRSVTHQYQYPHHSQQPPTQHDVYSLLLRGFSPNYRGDPSVARNQSAAIPAEANCSLFLVGLAPDLTTHELLSGIRNVGRVYATHINPPDPTRGHQLSAAKLVFFERRAAEIFYNRFAPAYFSTPRNPHLLARVTWNRIRSAEVDRQDDPDLNTTTLSATTSFLTAPTQTVTTSSLIGTPTITPPRPRSRVLLIAGPPHIVNAAFLCAYLDTKLSYQIDAILSRGQSEDGKRVLVEFRFGSFRCQAEAARMALMREFRDCGVVCDYGTDPCHRDLDAEEKVLGNGV